MIIDESLFARLETSSAALSARIAEVMTATRVPGVAAPVPWRGGMLVALGAGRYINRAVGFGAAEVSAEQLGVAEDYFRDAGVPSMIEVSSWASASLLTVLGDRRYRPSWTRNVYVRGLDPIVAEDVAGLEIRIVDDTLLLAWQKVLADGNGLTKDADRVISDEFALARYQAPDSPILLAFVDGEVAGCGSIEMIDGVAWVGGAATDPLSRNRGVQKALLQRRVEIAAEHGCDIVAASALPPGASARNLGRHGFDLAYTQTEFTRRR
ncbi:MAG: GNAT family N-acetyltransferase [Ilumatobacteraceae bacterium]